MVCLCEPRVQEGRILAAAGGIGLEDREFLVALSQISGLLDVIEDALEQILLAQFDIADKDWFEAIQSLETGYALTRQYVSQHTRTHARNL